MSDFNASYILQGLQQTLSKKRKYDENCDIVKKKLFLDNLQMSGIDAIKSTEHGKIFQLKLLMMCLWRAAHTNKEKYTEYRLATEMSEAEKFDDIAFQYKDEDNMWKYRLLQVKHKESDYIPTIRLSNFLSINNNEDFSLQKYFRSFIKFEKKSSEKSYSMYSVIPGSKIEDVILITNASIDMDTKTSTIFIEDSQDIQQDDLFKTTKKGTCILKINSKQKNTLIDKLRIIFENTSDFYNLIELIAKHVCNNKKMEKINILNDYYYPLLNKIFKILPTSPVEKNKKLNFINFDKFIEKLCENQDTVGEDFIKFKNALIKEVIFRKGKIQLPEIDDNFGEIDLPGDENELRILAHSFANSVQNNKRIVVSDFKKYHIALAENILHSDKSKLCSKFINEPYLKEATHEMTALAKFKKYFESAFNEKPTKKYLRTCKIEVSENFGKRKLSSDEKMLNVLADTLVQCIKHNIKISAHNFTHAHIVLAEEVLDVNNHTFKNIFVNMEELKSGKVIQLSTEVIKFRRILLDKIEFHNIPIAVGNHEIIINKIEKLMLKKLFSCRIKVSDGFINAFKPEKNPEIKNIPEFSSQLSKLINHASKDVNEKTIRINEDIKTILKINNDDYKSFNNNINKLAGYVLITHFNKVRFSTDFLNFESENMPENIKIFRAELCKLLENNIFNTLYEYEFKFYKRKFAKPFKTCNDCALFKSLPILHNNKDVDDFFSTFKLIVNYPNRKEVEYLLNEEIKIILKSLDSELFHSSYYKSLHNWMANRIGTFYTPEKVKELFRHIQGNLSLLKFDGFNELYIGKFSRKYEFKKCGTVSKFLEDNNTILQLDFQDLPIGRIRIIQEFKELQAQNNSIVKIYTHQFGYLFMYLRQLKDKVFISNLNEAFMEHKFKLNLLVVECDSTENEAQELLSKIIISKKKIILLTYNSSDITKTIIKKYLGMEIINSDYQKFDKYFLDLTKHSRQNLLIQKVITFQKEKISLNDIVALSDESIEQIIDPNFFTKMISEQEIQIGNNMINKSYLGGPYSNYYDKVKIEVLIEILLQEKSDDLFLISQIDDNGQNKEKTFINILKKCCNMHINENIISKYVSSNKISIYGEFKEQDFKSLCHLNANKKIYWIKLENYNFLLYKIYHPYFLNREFKYPLRNIENDSLLHAILDEKNTNIIFFFSGISVLEDLYDVLKVNNINEKSKINELNEKENIIFFKEHDETQFLKCVEEYKNKNKAVCWFEIQNNDDNDQSIIWRDITRRTIAEAGLINVMSSKSSILIDKPGMGKSTTLISLTEKMYKSHWVMYVALNDWQQLIADLSEDIDIVTVVDFLCTTNKLTLLEKKLLRYILACESNNVRKSLLIVFDGFDEIRNTTYVTENTGKKKVEKMLRYLREKPQCTIWISAREHDAYRLKNTLLTFEIRFEPLLSCQKDYFHKIWRESLILRYTKDKLHEIFLHQFEKYYSFIYQAANNMLNNKSNNFMGIPLFLSLLAVGFRNKFIDYIDNRNQNLEKDFEKFNILNLYQYYIDAKFNIYFKEKIKISNKFLENLCKNKVVKMHCRLAFYEIFGDDVTKDLLGIKKPLEYDAKTNKLKFDGELLPELLHFGIIRSLHKDHFEFLHRSFAEYFTSEIFVNMLKGDKKSTKYRKIFEFIQTQSLKYSNWVIFNFIDARAKQDTTLNDIVTNMKEEINDIPNLFNSTNNRNTFELDRDNMHCTDTISEKSAELRQLVKSRMNWYPNDTFDYYAKIEDVKKLIMISNTEEDIEELMLTVEFFFRICGKSNFGIFNGILTLNTVMCIFTYFINQVELRNELNLKKNRIEEIIRHIESSTIQKHTESELIEQIDIPANDFDRKILFHKLRKSFILTKDMVTKFKSNVILHLQNNSAWDLLLIPFLNYKYLSKYSPTSFTNIDPYALVDMFLTIFDSKKDFALFVPPVEGLLQCMADLMRNFVLENFIITVKALIALEEWNFTLTCYANVFYLHHKHPHYESSPLEIQYSSKIVKLLMLRLREDRSVFDIDKECKDIFETILSENEMKD